MTHELIKLSELKEKGILSEDEFQAKKKNMRDKRLFEKVLCLYINYMFEN